MLSRTVVTSRVKVSLMMNDAGAVGLNLNTACDEVLIATVVRLMPKKRR